MNNSAIEKIKSFYESHNSNFINYIVKKSNEILEPEDVEKYTFNQILIDIGLSKYADKDEELQNVSDIMENIMIYGGKRIYTALVNQIIEDINRIDKRIGSKMFEYFMNRM